MYLEYRTHFDPYDQGWSYAQDMWNLSANYKAQSSYSKATPTTWTRRRKWVRRQVGCLSVERCACQTSAPPASAPRCSACFLPGPSRPQGGRGRRGAPQATRVDAAGKVHHVSTEAELARVWRDHVVPLAAAHLPGAAACVTLDCLHSVNVAGTKRPSAQWYGAEKQIDGWLVPLVDVLVEAEKE